MSKRPASSVGAWLFVVFVITTTAILLWLRIFVIESEELPSAALASSVDAGLHVTRCGTQGSPGQPRRSTFPPLSDASCRDMGSSRACVIDFSGHYFDTYELDLCATDLRFYHELSPTQAVRNARNLRKYLATKGHRLRFATNGGIFHSTLHPVGLYVHEGKVIQPLNLENGHGNFFLKPNGVFSIGFDGTARVTNSHDFVVDDTTRFATQSGPLLIMHGQLHPAFVAKSQNRRIRSGVGIRDKNRIVFAISRAQLTFYTFAKLFKDRFQCRDALYLDGTISRMYLPANGRYDDDGQFAIIIADVASDE